MNIKKSTIKGVTLLEVLLVLAVISSIIILSIRQYQIYRLDADVHQVRFNIDQLTNAAAGYYQANCTNGGTLDPDSSPTSPYVINVTSDLINKGFLPANALGYSPLIDNASPLGAYQVQFNKYTTPRQVCVRGTNATGITPSAGCTSALQIGTLVIWKIQVAVLLNDSTLAQQYQNLFLADCVSTKSATGIVSCSQSASFSALCQFYRNIPPNDPLYAIYNSLANNMGCPTSGSSASYNNYVVWERLPSFATPDTQSPFWQTNPLVQQFTQMYSTYPITYLTGANHTTEFQYFCGR